MGRPKKVHICGSCGKVFPSRQAKFCHKSVRCEVVSNGALVSCTGAGAGSGVVVPFVSTKKITAAVHRLFDEMPQKPSDQAIEQFSSTMAEIIRGEAVDAAEAAEAAEASSGGGVEGGGAGNVVVNTGDHSVNNITVNNYRIVSTDYVDHADMVKLIKARDLHESLQHVVELLHFNPDHPENMNAYLSNAMAEHGYSYGRGRWTKKPRNDLAKGVMLNAGSLMNEHNDDPYTGDYTVGQTTRFDKFYHRFDLCREPLMETIETMVKLKGTVENVHPELRSMSSSPPLLENLV